MKAEGESGGPGWRVVGASVRGLSHQQAKLPCQDVLEWQLARGTLLAAMADGAGSATLAEAGAATAVKAALANLTGLWSPPATSPATDDAWRAALRGAFLAARAAVLSEAAAHGVKPRELASTLIVLVAQPGLAAAGQIGDGAVIVGDAETGLRVLTRPWAAEYLNETAFLVSDNALDALQVGFERKPFRHISLFSDGLQLLALKLPEAFPHGPFFRPLFQFLERTDDLEQAQAGLTAFLQSPRVTQRADDDLTLLLAQLKA